MASESKLLSLAQKAPGEPRRPPKVTFVEADKSNGKTIHFKPGLDHFVSGGVPGYFLDDFKPGLDPFSRKYASKRPLDDFPARATRASDT